MYIGIDLGTSNSAVAGIAGGRVKLFKTPEGTDTMPSVVYRDRRGNQTVGVRAFDQALLAPENAVDGFKRLMGTETSLHFTSTGETVNPEQVATEILRTLVGYALVESGAAAVTGAVVTIPAAFNQVQSEATLAAARAACLERVALLQEPVAAALACMAGAQDRSGVFLVYDLGGGTFDVALVDARQGEVTVLAHEGVNMLGGRDLDRIIMDEVALPWLRRNFELPENLTADRKYDRLRRIIRRSAEVAKIDLSSQMETSIAAADEQVRLDDLHGEPIYLDIPLKRSQLESAASGSVDRTIDCCRTMLAQSGFRHEDVARIVLIGGPTKMPMVRRRVQDELGIEVEDISRVDPMTAVAAGAAIYCESRNWSTEGSTAKASRLRESSGGGVKVAYDFEARTASDCARLQITQESGQAGADVLVESVLGWSSGRCSLAKPVILELPLRDAGPNRFRATIFGRDGSNIVDASRDIVVERLLAATGGVPATHTIAAKILGDDGKNTLDVIIQKGTLLPATGVGRYRTTQLMRAGGAGVMRIYLFQIDDGQVLDPDLNLCIGEFQVRADDLPEDAVLRKGDEVIVHWAMSEGQEITTEVELPTVSQRFDRRNYYNWQLARINFAGEDGAKVATTHLERAERSLSDAEDVLPPPYATALPRLRERLDTCTAAVRGSVDPDARRQAVEEIRYIRQAIAGVCQQPDARRELLKRRLTEEQGFYDRDVRAGATRDQVAQVDILLQSAQSLIAKGSSRDLSLAEDQISEVDRLYWRHGVDQYEFCIRYFGVEREKRYLAADPITFDRAVSSGDKAIANLDAGALRDALFVLWRGKISIGGDIHDRERASLMRK
jgi:molecular chaperone DnaK